jgi:hypothetical protein
MQLRVGDKRIWVSVNQLALRKRVQFIGDAGQFTTGTLITEAILRIAHRPDLQHGAVETLHEGRRVMLIVFAVVNAYPQALRAIAGRWIQVCRRRASISSSVTQLRPASVELWPVQ